MLSTYGTKNKGSSKRQETMMWRRMEIFSKKSRIGPKAYNTAYSQVVTQPSTDAAQQDLTSVIGREPLFFFFLKQAQWSPIY